MKGKAFYNLIKLKWEHDPDVRAEPWQIEDLRTISDEDLFKRFAGFEIPLNHETLMLYAEKCDSPEELVDCLLLDPKDEKLLGQVYLLSFEAWRRFCSHKQTLSLFCDELDHLISAHDQDTLEDKQALYDQLFELCVMIDQHIDAGGDIGDVKSLIETWCAHDLESFIYEYVAALIDEDEDAAASELLETFAPYAQDQAWFDFLRVRLLAKADVVESKIMLERLFAELVEEPDLDLGLEMLRFLATLDEKHAFQILLEQISSWMHTESDFQQLLSTVRDYFCALDHEKEEAHIASMLEKRASIDPDTKFFPNDKELISVKSLVDAKFKAQF